MWYACKANGIGNQVGAWRYSDLIAIRSKAPQSLCYMLYIVMPSLNKISYLILSNFMTTSVTIIRLTNFEGDKDT